MTDRRPLDINLATRPRRNRRLFLLLAGVLSALLIGLLAWGAVTLMRYGREASRLKATAAAAEARERQAQREERRLAADVQKQERLHRSLVDLTNGIILKKTFRWTGLLTALEESLPDSSYITFLSPGFNADNTVSVRLRVVSSRLDDLTSFIDRLAARGFEAIQVYGESRGEAGRTVTEISATYGRPH